MSDNQLGDYRVIIEPTSTVTDPDGKLLYSDIALTNVYSQHTLQVSSVRTVHWQIYSAMLLANSIIMGVFLVRIGNAYFQLLGGMVGFVFCVLWYRIVRDNWYVFFRRCDEGSRFYWRIGGELEQKHNRANVFLLQLNMKKI